MTATAGTGAFVAINRFGLGAQPGDLSRIDSDPQSWLQDQLAASPALPPELTRFGPGSEQARALQQAIKDKSLVEGGFGKKLRALYIDEMGQRALAAIQSRTPLLERLTRFWSNHFTVSIANKPVLAGLVGAFEREAIRPHVTGRFADMLQAAISHPAMLIYLDNATSVGPNSRGGRLRDKGLNENLAREALELHSSASTAATARRTCRPSRGSSPAGASAGCRVARPASSCSGPTSTSPATRRCSASATPRRGSRRARRFSPISPAIRRRRIISPPSWRAISSPISRRPMPWIALPRPSATATAICGR
jgi:Protein of unknown function (DUF1800)